MPGFLAGTQIMTTFGAVPVELLRTLDPVVTLERGMRRLRRVDRIKLDASLLARCPEAQPIRIKAGAIAKGVPERDLLVSPGQELYLVSGGFPRRQMATQDIRGYMNIFPSPVTSVTYYVLEFDEPVVVYADGLPALIPRIERDTDSE